MIESETIRSRMLRILRCKFASEIMTLDVQRGHVEVDGADDVNVLTEMHSPSAETIL